MPSRMEVGSRFLGRYGEWGVFHSASWGLGWGCGLSPLLPRQPGHWRVTQAPPIRGPHPGVRTQRVRGTGVCFQVSSLPADPPRCRVWRPLPLLFVCASPSPALPSIPVLPHCCRATADLLHSFLLKVARLALCYLSSHTLPDLEMARSRALFLYSLAVPPLRARSAGRCKRGWGRVCDAHGRTGGKHLNVCVI